MCTCHMTYGRGENIFIQLPAFLFEKYLSANALQDARVSYIFNYFYYCATFSYKALLVHTRGFYGDSACAKSFFVF